MTSVNQDASSQSRSTNRLEIPTKRSAQPSALPYISNAQRRARCTAAATSVASTAAPTAPLGTCLPPRRLRSTALPWLESTDPLLRWDRADPELWCESSEANDIADPIDPAEANEPMLANEAQDAALPIERNESWEQIERTEFSDQSDHTSSSVDPARTRPSSASVGGAQRDLDVDHWRAVDRLEAGHAQGAGSLTSSTVTVCRPMGFGRSGERVANTPVIGRLGSLRGRVSKVSRSARCNQVSSTTTDPASIPCSAWPTSSSKTSSASGAPSSP